MSITIKRNTGWQGMGSKIHISVNGERVDSISYKKEIEVSIPGKKALLQVSQLGVKSNEIEVKDGDRVEIKQTIWQMMALPLMILLILLANFIPNPTYASAILPVLGILIIISLFAFKGFKLILDDR